jgi:serine/threonine-protein kinase
VLYEMLTGCQPFSGATPVHVAFQHVHSDISAPSNRVPSIPAEVDDLVAALAARNPAERPADAAVALGMLRHLQGLGAPSTGRHRRGDLNQAPPADWGTPRPLAAGPAPAPVDAPSPADGSQATQIFTQKGGSTIALPIGLGLGPAGVPSFQPGPPGYSTPGPAQPYGPGHPAAIPPPLPPSAPRRRLLTGPWVWIVPAGVAIVVLMGVLLWWFFFGARIAVPDLANKHMTTAASDLTEVGLTASWVEEFHSTIPPETVIRTDPAAGKKVQHGTRITVVVSKGPDLVTIPSGLVGMTYEEASLALTTAGLTPSAPEEKYDDNAAEGKVMAAQKPDGTDIVSGDQAVRGDTITLTVSKGPEPVTVPSLTGLTVRDATDTLTQLGLKFRRGAEQTSDTIPAGQVISQDPPADQTVRRGDTITVTISTGPPLVTMPNVVSQDYDDAKALHEGLGLRVKREDIMGGRRGTVMAQSVRVGDQVEPGTEVTLMVR